MDKDQLSHRERVRLALDRQVTDRIPIAMVCAGINEPARVELERHLQVRRGIGVDEYLEPIIDIRVLQPRYVGPPLADDEDIWSVRRKPVSYGAGAYDEICHYPLAEATSIDDVLAHRWPTTDWFDYESIPDRIRRINAGQEFCLLVPNSNVFESAWYLRGFERALLDLAAQPEILDGIMAKVTDFYVAHNERVLQAAGGRIDLMFTADDIGGQNGLLMSLDMWSRHVKPHHVRINEGIHRHGAKVIYHTDGAVMDAVGGLIDMGIDVLQALQFDAAGMDPVALKSRWGERLCFEGGVSVQSTLPFGRPDDVRREVVERIAVLGRGGGYILGPSHAIQAGTPPENIVAMFDTALSTPMTP